MTATVRSLPVPLALFGLTLLGCAEADAPSPPAAETPSGAQTPAPSGPEVVDPGNGRRYRDNPNRKVLVGPPDRLPPDTTAFFKQEVATDWSGTIAVEVVACSDDVNRHHNIGIFCSLDSDFVVTGGGASANFGFGPGALLIESRPFDSNLGAWVGSSKDHLVSSPHTLTVYAVGIRLAGVSRADLRGQMQLKQVVAPFFQNQPNLSAKVDPEFMLVGGGVSLLNPGGNNVLLTGSFPSPDGTAWTGTGKDHVTPDTTRIQVFAIGLRPSIPFFGNIARAVVQRSFTFDGFTGPGFPGTVDVQVTPGTIPVGPGAVSNWAPGQGRLLFGIDVNAGGVRAWDKDHVKADPNGTITAFAIELWKTN